MVGTADVGPSDRLVGGDRRVLLAREPTAVPQRAAQTPAELAEAPRDAERAPEGEPSPRDLQDEQHEGGEDELARTGSPSEAVSFWRSIQPPAVRSKA